MRVIRGLDFEPLQGVVLSIGNFDGVHRGHQTILAAARDRARANGAELVVMTFEPHPLAVLTPERMPAILTTLPRKLDLFSLAGVDAVALVSSKPELLHIEANEFIRQVIVDRFNPCAVVEGPSFGFGRHREGNVEALIRAGHQYGFDVQVVEPVRVALGGHPDTVISSSLVRQLLSSGTVDQAAICLGRPYALLGTVVRGIGRGAKLGFPTANIEPDYQLIPADGVYAGRAILDNRCYSAAISVGRTPTFDDCRFVIEAHLLDFAGDSYGAGITVEFLHWLRPQLAFPSVAELCRQIAADVARTRQLVTSHA